MFAYYKKSSVSQKNVCILQEWLSNLGLERDFSLQSSCVYFWCENLLKFFILVCYGILHFVSGIETRMKEVTEIACLNSWQNILFLTVG